MLVNQSKKQKKKDYNAKILDIESKYFTTGGYNKFTSQILHRKIKQKGLADKSANSGFKNNTISIKRQQHQQQKENYKQNKEK